MPAEEPQPPPRNPVGHAVHAAGYAHFAFDPGTSVFQWTDPPLFPVADATTQEPSLPRTVALAALVGPADLDDLGRVLDAAVQGKGTFVWCGRVNTPTGVRSLRLRGAYVTQGTDRGHVLGLAEDAAHQADMAYAAHHLAAIVQTSEDAILSKTLEGTILSWNRGAQRMFGYTADETIGRNVTMLFPPGRVNEEPAIVQRIVRGERVEHYETVRRRKDGSEFHVSLSVSPIIDEHGRIVGASKIARDITEQKELQAALQRSNDQKDRFLATLAHELRNPLAPLSNGLSLLTLMDDLPQDQAQVLQIMRRQLDHLVLLVDDLMDLSRIDRGKVELDMRTLDLSEVVRAAFEISGSAIAQKAHEVHLTVPEGLWVKGDQVRLVQVISNLLNNAAKYTPSNGMLRIEAGQSGDRIHIRVGDNGIGIPANALDRVFDMFTQMAAGPTEGTKGGLGIGLHIVRQLVQLHGGTVRAESLGPGRGSTFHIELPAAHAPATPTSDAIRSARSAH